MKPLSMGIDNRLPTVADAIGEDVEQTGPRLGVACHLTQPDPATAQTEMEAA